LKKTTKISVRKPSLWVEVRTWGPQVLSRRGDNFRVMFNVSTIAIPKVTKRKLLFIVGNEYFPDVALKQKRCYYAFFAKVLEIFHVPPEEFRNHRTRIVISNFTERKIVKVDDALHYRL
jgi:hypothetical protein